MGDRAKHAFGSSSGVESALQSGAIDAYDILFLDGDTANPKVGWVTAEGKAVIATGGSADLTDLEKQVDELETQMETKVDEERVQEMIESNPSAYIEIVEF